MQQRTVEQVETWESRPFSGGYSDLQDLSDESFSGAVVADDTWLFMLNGRVVGVFQGTIDDFEDGTGTVYHSPHDSLPLLFSMQERGGETRAKYFTNDTSLAEADQTLREANFTGYVELSENVLSGDYYVIYYGGKQMSAAFIGQSERLLTGEEAYERAADEVGIYEVKDVSMNITEIPAPRQPESEPEPEPESETGPTTAATGGDRAESSDVETAVDEAEPTPGSEPTESPEESTADRPSDVSIDPERTRAEADSGPDTAPTGADSESSSTEADGEPATSDASPTETGAEPNTTSESSPTEADAESDRPEQSPSSDDPSSTDTEKETGTRRSVDSGTDRPEETGIDPSPSEVEPADTEPEEQRPVFKEEEEWRQTRSIPALDPDETAGEREKKERQARKRSRRTKDPARSSSSSASSSSSPSSSSPPAASSAPNSQPESRPENSEPVPNKEQLQKLERAVKERDSKIDELTSSLDEERVAREDVQSQLDELRDERNELEERISNLESALQRAKDQQAAVSPDAVELDPEEALSGTNLFVRYESKGKPTLSSLEAGEVDPEAVNSNLTLEHHTQFESENAMVVGQTFEAFLEETNSYRFVSWLVRTLPYELLESGKRNALSELYEAIPDIDRVEFDGSVTVETEEGSATREFDVVIRDRMGNPLIVANLNSGRDAVRGEQMSDLIESATVVSGTEETLSGAFYVTASFFEPNALEAAEEAASTGGLFRRSEKASYVKSASKSGYHLCLIEDRAESFHVTVPEL